MKTIIFGALLAALSFGVSAQTDVWNAGYVPNSSGSGATRAWSGPGWNYTSGAVARGAAVSAGTGGLTVLETGAVATGDGRLVTLAASRFASNSNIFAALGAVARGPYGLAVAIALPYVISWIAGDGEVHIRRAPDGQSLQKKVDSSLFHVTCQGQVFSGTGVALAASCSAAWNAASGCGIVAIFTAANHVYSGATAACPFGMWDVLAARDSTANDWLPASMDDIAPYMTPRVPGPAILAQIVGAGQPVDVAPVSVTTVTPPPALTPYVETTTYPKPADKTTTVTVPGNPFSLPNNTPTVTNQNTSSAPLNPGSVSKTGVPPSGVSAPAPGPVVTPTQSTTTSTFNPTTNATTSDTVTAQDAAQQVSTSTTNTTINNTINNSYLTYNTTNVTNVTNVTTNTPLTPTKTDTSPESPTTPAAAPVEFNMCGLPGQPACKMDEAGTPQYQAPTDPTIAAKAAELAKIATITAAPSLFVGWSALFDAPAISTCTPFVLPSFAGQSMGSIDPCPVVSGVRSVMGYIWALTAMFLCLGMIKKAV